MKKELLSEQFRLITSTQRDDIATSEQFCAKNSSAKIPILVITVFAEEGKGRNIKYSNSSPEKGAVTTVPDWEHIPCFL